MTVELSFSSTPRFFPLRELASSMRTNLLVFVIVLFGLWFDGSGAVERIAVERDFTTFFLVLDVFEVVVGGSDVDVGALVTGLFCIESSGDGIVIGLLIGDGHRDGTGDGPGEICESVGDTDLDSTISTSSSAGDVSFSRVSASNSKMRSCSEANAAGASVDGSLAATARELVRATGSVVTMAGVVSIGMSGWASSWEVELVLEAAGGCSGAVSNDVWALGLALTASSSGVAMALDTVGALAATREGFKPPGVTTLERTGALVAAARAFGPEGTDAGVVEVEAGVVDGGWVEVEGRNWSFFVPRLWIVTLSLSKSKSVRLR